MPIKIPDSLPATAVLESENIFVMTEYRAMASGYSTSECTYIKFDADQGSDGDTAAPEAVEYTAAD